MKPISIRRYDTLKPDIFFEASVGKDSLYITAERQPDGSLKVEPNHGYEPGSPEYRRDQALFDRHADAIQAAAEKFLPQAPAIEAPKSAMTRLRDFAPTQFDRKGMDAPKLSDWLVVCSRHRDSRSIEISNFSVAQGKLTEQENDDVDVVGSGHWAVGYVEALIVKPGTPSAALAEQLHQRIRDNIILDEDDVTQHENATYDEAWTKWGASEFATELVKKGKLSERESDLVESADKEMLQDYFERLNECGDYLDEDGMPVIRRSIACVNKDNLAEFLGECRLEASARKRAYESIVRPGSTVLSQIPEESAKRMIDRCQKYMSDNPSLGLNQQTAERIINSYQKPKASNQTSEHDHTGTSLTM